MNREKERLLTEFRVPSEPGNERRAMDEVAAVVAGHGLSERKYERLKTAVAETMMNAIEHGNEFDPEKLARVEVSSSGEAFIIRVTDDGRGPLDVNREAPDIEAKLGGEQTPRGWGLFLIKNMADEMNVTGDESHHTVELVFYTDEANREGGA